MASTAAPDPRPDAAVDAAPEDDPAEAGEPRVLVASLDAGWVAAPAEQVEGVVRPVSVTPVGGTARWVAGVAAVRGQVLAVVDARRLAGALPAEGAADAWWVLVAHGGRTAAISGLRVWRIAPVASTAGNDPAEAAPAVPGLPAGGVVRLARDSGRGGDALPPAVRLLDVAALLDLVHDPTHAP